MAFTTQIFTNPTSAN